MDAVARYGRPFSIILFDLDHFKQVNDKFGHLVGDEILVSIGEILLTNTRNVDLPGRWGGEEFLLICPETELSAALALGLAAGGSFGDAARLASVAGALAVQKLGTATVSRDELLGELRSAR